MSVDQPPINNQQAATDTPTKPERQTSAGRVDLVFGAGMLDQPMRHDAELARLVDERLDPS